MHLILIFTVKFLPVTLLQLARHCSTFIILSTGSYEFVLLLLNVVLIIYVMLGRMCVHSCSPECYREHREATEAEEMWVAWLSKDGNETGQLYSSGAHCSIRLDLNIALESRSCLPIPPRLCGTPAQSSFLILGNTVQIWRLGWPNNSPVFGARSHSTSAFYLLRVILNKHCLKVLTC